MLSKVSPTPAALTFITASRELGFGSGRDIKTDFSPHLGTTMACINFSYIESAKKIFASLAILPLFNLNWFFNICVCPQSSFTVKYLSTINDGLSPRRFCLSLSTN
jgi:hypothetical protein